jgi:hypothetical protein
LFHYISGETWAPAAATVNADGSLTESGSTYTAIFKPSTPPPDWVKLPWIDSTNAFNGLHSVGFEIDPHTPDPGSGTPTDKVQLRVSHAGESSDLEFDNKRYLGFDVKLPSAAFQAPTLGAVQIAQWWQGSPYTPPLSLVVDGGTTSAANYELIVHNNSTLGNPSAPTIVLGTGTIPYDTWTTFVVMTIMDFSGAGQVKLWQNNTQLLAWTGSDAYDPTTIPYKNPPPGTPNPNSAFDVFIGPYRDQQNTTQRELFDEVRWADTFADATPQIIVPEPAAQVTAVCATAMWLLQWPRRLRRPRMRRRSS